MVRSINKRVSRARHYPFCHCFFEIVSLKMGDGDGDGERGRAKDIPIIASTS